jgi:hypothetical protein
MAKELSGAQKRKRRAEKLEQQAALERAAANDSDDGGDGDQDSIIAKYAQLGEPPDDPLLGQKYALDHILIAMHDLAVDRFVKPPQKRVGLGALGRTAGMLGPKAHEKARLADAAKRLKRKGKTKDGDDHAEPYTGRGTKPQNG